MKKLPEKTGTYINKVHEISFKGNVFPRDISQKSIPLSYTRIRNKGVNKTAVNKYCG